MKIKCKVYHYCFTVQTTANNQFLASVVEKKREKTSVVVCVCEKLLSDFLLYLDMFDLGLLFTMVS